MSIAIAVLGVGFVSFAVWLTVRIVNRRERWAKRLAAVLVAVPVLFVASFGPACWISERTGTGEMALSVGYQPLFWLCMRSGHAGRVLLWYALVGTRHGGYAINTVDGIFVISW